jgi:predicted nucleic acid-binding protein
VEKYLVIFDANWADEFNCQQFTIKDSLEEAQALVNSLISQEEVYFGSNESFQEGELSADAFRILNISAHDADIIISLLGKEFGTGVL